MPDATSAPEAPKFTPKEVLQAGDTSVNLPGITPEQLQRQKDLEQLRKDGKSGKEGLQMASETTRETSFGRLQLNAFELKFGAGETEENPATHLVEAKANATPAEKASFERAKRAAEQASAFLQYSSILAESERTGISIPDTIRSRVARGDTSIKSAAEYDRQRIAGLDALLSSGYIKSLFPELADPSMHPEYKRKYIEKTLGREIGLRTTIATKFRELSARAEALPEVAKDDELKNAEKEQKSAKTKAQEGVDQIVKSIETDTGQPLDPAEKKAIEDAIGNGATPEQILRQIRQLTVEKVPHYAEFSKISELKNRTDEAFARWNQGKIPTTMNKNAIPNQAAVDAANKLYSQYETLSNEYDALMNTVNQNRPDYDKFVDFDRRYPTAGAANSEIGAKLAELYQNQVRIRELDTIIADKRANPNTNERDSRNARLQAESDLVDEVENIFSESAQEVLLKRYEQLAELDEKGREKDAKEGITADDKAIAESMRENWIKFDRETRTKSVSTVRIQEDMLTIAYKGEDGLKRLLLREMQLQIPKLDASGNPIPGAFEDLYERETYENIDLNRLTEEQKKRLDDAYNKHADTYRNKLMKDFFASKTLKDKLKGWVPGSDKLGLSKDEWRMLEENFRGQLASGLAKSKEAGNVLKNLEASGIKPDSKMKWLIYILIAIIGAGAVATVGAGAVGVAATGIGKAT